MRRSTWIPSLIILTAFQTAVHGTTAIPPTQLSSYRPVGEKRTWTFVVQDSAIGHLVSTTTGPTSLEGLNGSGVTEDLSLDYTKAGSDLVMEVVSNHVVTEGGGYLGDDMTIKVKDTQDSLFLAHQGDSVRGFMIHGAVRQPVAAALPSAWGAWDLQFVDQLELYLATHGVSVGQMLRDTLFAPRPLTPTYLEGKVESFRYVNVYNQVFDSGFVINLTQPQQMRLLFTKDRRLAKVDIPAQETRIFLDAVTKPKPTLPKPPGVTLSSVIKRIPAFLVFLLITVAVLSFFLGRQITLVHGYIAAASAAAVFWLVPFTQVPLQQAAIAKGLIPALQSGGSIYLWGIIPALIAGLIQTLLLVAVIQIIKEVRGLKPERLWILGAFCGAGFGFMEACYLAVTVPSFLLLSYGILERAFVLIFHVSAGLLIGLAMRRGTEFVIQTGVLIAIVNALLRYLPVFAQQRVFGPEILSVILAFVSLSVALSALLWLRKAASSHAADHPIRIR